MLYSMAPKDTLAYWLKGRALSANIDRRNHRVNSVATALEGRGYFGVQNNPEHEAFQFYLLNHAAAEIAVKYDQFEPLPSEALEVIRTYSETGSAIAERLFFYVFLITAREARHNHSSYEPTLIIPLMHKHYPDLGADMIKSMYQFFSSFPDSSQAMGKIKSAPDSFKIGPFCKMLQVVYYHCKWGSAFGGKKWGNIADCLYRMVSGEWTPELFADTAFTLAHNTAPIFNKGMLYTTPNESSLVKLLDVQRAGMMPQYAADGYQPNKSLIAMLNKNMPGFISGSVDWQKVQDLGAVGTYVAKPPKPAVPKPPAVPDVGSLKIDHGTAVKKLAGRAP